LCLLHRDLLLVIYANTVAICHCPSIEKKLFFMICDMGSVPTKKMQYREQRGLATEGVEDEQCATAGWR
jgi:hypothetical protein